MIYYYVFLNALSFFTIAWDKHLAKQHRFRIPESYLLFYMITGGWLGGYLAMWICHHKTRKFKFHFVVFLSTVLHFILLSYLSLL